MYNPNPYLNKQPRQSKDETFNDLHTEANQAVFQGQPIYAGQPPGQFAGQYPPPYAHGPVVIVVQNNKNQTPCLNCKRPTNSIIQYRNGWFVWLMALIICLFTGCLCFIAFLIQDWKEK